MLAATGRRIAIPRRAKAAKGDLPLAAIRLIEGRAFTRAADLAKSYAEKYEAEDRTTRHKRRRIKSGDWSAEIKVSHWRIIEKASRDLCCRT